MREKEKELKEGIAGTYRTFKEWEEAFRKFEEGEPVRGYDRYSYPELVKREKEVAELINVEKVLLYNSGMTAISEVLESLYLTKNDVLLYSPSVYGETKNLMEDFKKRGVICIPINPGKIEEVEKAIEEFQPKAIFVETVGNAPDMPVVNLDLLFKKVEETNKLYQEKLKLSDILKKMIERKFKLKDEGEINSLVEDFTEVVKEINRLHSYMPLRKLVRELEEKKIIKERRWALLELKSILDTAWLIKREKPLTLILDNTIPTETGLDLPKKIKQTKAPVLVVDSGTKFFALNLGTMGLVYSNSPEKMAELYVQRMRRGGYLPRAVEALLPERKKEEFEIRNKRILKNTKLLAEAFSKIVGKIGIIAVSHPNLPTHPNYEYTKKNMPEGSTGVFYIFCKNAWETGKILDSKLKGLVEYGGSFAFEKTRIGIFGDDIIRIAGGNESPEELEKLLEAIESIK